MDWCKINKDYLLYLKQYEPRVPDFEYFSTSNNNKTKKLFKPFFYMLKDLGDYCYVGQVNHYNPAKHDKLKNALDFKKVYDLKTNIPLCVVNLNYIFPVPKNEIIKITPALISNERDFDNNNEKTQYISLLRKELNSINSMDLAKAADRLINLKRDEPTHKVSLRCFDYDMLEAKCKDWIKNKH